MFVYNQSEVYGNDPEMRHSHGHTNKLANTHGNNNNSSSISNHHNDQRDIPFCNIETAFNHCTNVNTVGSPWNLTKVSNLRSSAKSSPQKNNIIPRPILCNPKYAAVPLTDPSMPFFDDGSSYVPRNLGQPGATTSRGNNNGHLYQQIRHYYTGGSNTSRQQYGPNNGVPASQQELTKFSPEPRNKDERKRQTKADRNQYYADDGSEYSMHPMDAFMQSSWSTVISDRSSRLPSADQHYEHYFSYFYNRGKDQLPKKKTHNPVCTYKPMSLFQDTPSKRSQCKPNRITSNDNNNKNGEYDSYIVLNENNEMPFGYNDNEWVELDDVPEKPEILCNDEYEPKDYTNDDPFDPTFMQSTQRRFVQQPSENNEIEKHISEDTLTCNGNNNNNNNYNNHTRSIIGGLKKVQTATTESCSQPQPRLHAAQQSYPRLPLTPKRVRGGLPTAKKILPTVHRVLLYNSQSPRLTRKHHSTNSRNQNVKAPHPKGQSGGQDQASDHTSKYIFDDSELKDVEKKEFRDVDFDNDDDLDNISNFDESDTVSLGSDTEDGYRAHAYKMAHSSDRLSSSPKNSLSLLLSQSSDEDLRTPSSVLVPSLFPYVPPYISFSSNAEKGPDVPAELHRVLKWRVTSIMPKVVRLILANSGMRMLKSKSFFETNDWMGVWGKHLKSPCFKTIRSYQKINHLPGSFRIGRKDSCWKNLQRQMRKHSNREFGFMPRTYVIPNDLGALRKRWPVYAQRNTKWIIKPPASARGAGIRVVNRWGQIPKRRPLIVQKYIERPLLINGSKFDLRLYVLVTSVNPLRVFMYHNGLARFASVKYSAKIDTLNDRCMHLTNYSINKFSSNYSKNEDVNACHGHKWTIKSLWNYLANRGVRTDGLWEALRSLVLRTILAGENGINSMIRANVESKYSCFELFGFDVILDSDLVPWLLEVNISPSLHSELPLDAHVKAPLVQGVLNTALYNIPPKLTSDKQKELAAEFCFPPGTQMCYDKRLYINYLSREEKLKHQHFTRKNMENREEYINAILEKLTPDDVRCLIIAEDELARCAPLERIFPTDQTFKYLKYNDQPRYYNRLLDAWESRYGNNRTEGIALLRDLCQTKYHLQVPVPPAKKDWNASPNDDNVKKPPCDGEEESEIPLPTKKITMNSEACKKKHNQLEEN